MSEYGRYPEYKDSGVPWLGEIPSHWQNKRLKYTITNVSEKVDAQTSDLRYFGLENIQSFTGKLLSDVELVSEGVGNTFKKDDVLFGKLRPYLAKVYLAKDDGLSSTEALIFRATENIDPKFLFYYCLSPDFISAVNGTTFGSKMPRASWDDIASFKMVYPSLDEQAQIANFLDHELGKIDALIDKQQLLLDKLAEQRSAVITQAVTKGLNPNAEMKDSGIEWLGKMPKHWSKIALHYLTSLKSGNTITALDFVENGNYPVFGGGGFRGYIDKFTHEGEYNLIGRQGALCGNITLANGKFFATEHAVVVTPVKQLNNKWLNYLLYTMNLNQYSTSSAQPGVSAEVIGRLRVPLPSLEEQIQIADFLNQETQKIDQMTETVNRTIERLKEYRSTLITQAVTGKIKVF